MGVRIAILFEKSVSRFDRRSRVRASVMRERRAGLEQFQAATARRIMLEGVATRIGLWVDGRR